MTTPGVGEWDWVVTMAGRVLHHPAVLRDEEAFVDAEPVWATLSCGRQTFVHMPGMFTRMGANRCLRCCEAVGYPRGWGSPKNDPACRPLVEARVEQQYDIEEAD